MLHGPTLVTVIVTNAVLHEIENAPPGVGGYLACFQKHRLALEQVASDKHQRGPIEESGAVIVQAGDLKTFTQPTCTTSARRYNFPS
jgi:hypothetical protein